MRAAIVLGIILILQLVQLGSCDNDDEVQLSERQNDCGYMWMMMGSGLSTAGLNSWLLLCVGIAAALFSTDVKAAAVKEA